MLKYPIGESLIGIHLTKSRNDNVISRIKLIFQDNTVLTLLPVSDTDEICIKMVKCKIINNIITTPAWGKSFLDKKLMSVWQCKNNQGYHDQVIFAFEHLKPNLSFLSEGSNLKIFKLHQL